MWLELATVDGGVPHAAVVALHVDLGSDGAFQAGVAALLHLLPQLQVFGRAVVAVLGLLASFTLGLNIPTKDQIYSRDLTQGQGHNCLLGVRGSGDEPLVLI